MPAAPMVESMKLYCNGKVKSDGVVSVIFTPAGGQASEYRVTLQTGMKDKDVCRDIAKELSVGLRNAPYEVDESGDKIKVKGKKDAKFSLTLGAQTATGLTIELK
jgi:hypothetical protein